MRPHVLILTPSVGRSGGGVSEAARLFTESLVLDGRFSAEVVAFHEDRFDEGKAAWPNIPIHSFPIYGPRNYSFSPGMLRYMLSSKADIVHVHGIWMFHVAAAALWSALRQKPALVTPHGMLEPWILKRSSRLKAMVSLLYQKRFLNHNALHVLTAKERIDVAQAGLSTAQCHIIPNYVTPPRSCAGKPTWWKPEFEKRRLYLFLGRIHDKKGWRELCAAWEQLNKEADSFRHKAQLVFCGWPDNCPDFVPTVNKLNEQFGNAIFAGAQFGEDRERSYAAADIFLLPSKSEGLPMAILEAWAAGLPSLMTQACNLEVGFDVGASVKTEEAPSEIAAALRLMQSWTEEELTSAGKKAKDLAATRYSRESVSDAYCNLLDLYLKRQRKPHD